MGVRVLMAVHSCDFGNSLPLEKRSLYGEPLGRPILSHCFLPLVTHTMCFPLAFPLRSPSGRVPWNHCSPSPACKVSIESQNVSAGRSLRVYETNSLILYVRRWNLRKVTQLFGFKVRTRTWVLVQYLFLLPVTSGLLNIVLPNPIAL